MYDPTVNLGLPLKNRGAEILSRDGLRLGTMKDESTALALVTLANANAPGVQAQAAVHLQGVQATMDAVKARQTALK